MAKGVGLDWTWIGPGPGGGIKEGEGLAQTIKGHSSNYINGEKGKTRRITLSRNKTSQDWRERERELSTVYCITRPLEKG